MYPGAIYLHEGESWWVQSLDPKKIASVEPREVDYTQPVLDTNIRACAASCSGATGAARRFGEVTYSWRVIAMKKIQYRSLGAIGYHPLELPRLTLDTAGSGSRRGRSWGALARWPNPWEGSTACATCSSRCCRSLAMCDPMDLGGMIDSSNLGRPAIFLFDRYPGGLGFAEQELRGSTSWPRPRTAHLVGCPMRRRLPAMRGHADLPARSRTSTP